MDQRHIDYVQNLLQQGYTESQIHMYLSQHDWPATAIDAVFARLRQTTAPSHPATQIADQPTDVYAQQPQSYPGMFGRRINRIGFLLGGIYMIPLLALPLILGIISASQSSGAFRILDILAILISIIGVIAAFPINISLMMRRLHDVGLSGAVLILYLLFARGKEGVNQYGPPVRSLNFLVVLGFKKPVA